MHVFERGWLSANNILFTDGDQTLMVDSGYCTHAAQTLSLVKSVLGDRNLDVLVNTHLHSDHCGGNAALQAQYPSLHTLIPPGQAQQVTEWDAVALTYISTGQSCPPYKFSQTLLPGSEIWFSAKKWEVHAAGGHDPHALIFFNSENKLLISGDALWENGFGVVFPELEGENAFEELGTTLDLIEYLNPKIVIPGHGAIFGYNREVLTIARHRLNFFIQNPVKHARHAAKVLLKFKLLEIQQQPISVFKQWAIETPYFEQIRVRFFKETSVSLWIDELFSELISAGVAKEKAGYMLNV
ncbi:MAG: beta-lactamase domain protein [Polaromonas sp.]|nr:beta-lactamase domain protein [Polaromonas sp.]